MNKLYGKFKDLSITLTNLKVADLPERLEFEGDEFVVKPEFHITLINFDKLAKIIDDVGPEKLKPEIVDVFYEFVKRRPLAQYALLNELRLVRVAEDNKTIIVMAKLEGIDELFDALSKKYGVALPVQPTHITLYTLPTDTFGIPINSYNELGEISKQIELPEIEELLGLS